MQKIKTEIIIKAPIDKVWNKLTDFVNYPKWNPFITEISGNLAVGETLRVKICPPQKKPMIFTPKVLRMDQNQELRWAGKFIASGIFNGEHYFQLEKIDADTTRFIHGEIFSGLISGLILSMLGQAIRNGFTLMNEALRDKLA